MITEVSIRCQKNLEVGIRGIPAYTPEYTTAYTAVYITFGLKHNRPIMYFYNEDYNATHIVNSDVRPDV